MFRVVVIILDLFSFILDPKTPTYILNKPGACYFWKKKRPLPGSLDTVVRASVHGMSGVFVIILYACSYILVPKTPKYILRNLGMCCFWKKRPLPGNRDTVVRTCSHQNLKCWFPKMFLTLCGWRDTQLNPFLFNLIQNRSVVLIVSRIG